MKYIPHPYQERATEFLLSHTHCACLMEMGLGKSIITLTAIGRLIEDAEVCRVLVVAPLKVAETTWSSEAEKWDHTQWLRVSRVLGTEKQRLRALEAKADIYVMGRDSFVWLVKHYKGKLPFDMLVIDELTSFKSSKAQRFKAMRLARGSFDRIVGLTGTPAPNGYLDLWAQVFCIDGGERLGRFVTKYRETYFNTILSPQGYALRCDLRPGAKERIDALIADISIAMRAEDYLSLPDRQDIVQQVCLPDAVKKRYEDFERELVLETGDAQVSAANAAALMVKLAQFCNGAIYTDEQMVQEIHDEKLRALTEIVESAGSPVLVFYQFRHDIPRIVEAVEKMRLRVVSYQDARQLEEWNEGKIDVLLAHPASCAYGLNLQQGGHIIIWFGTGWNLEQYQQANARLHRQGQRYPVLVYNLVCKGTVDERALAALHGKRNTQDALMATLSELVKKHKG